MQLVAALVAVALVPLVVSGVTGIALALRGVAAEVKTRNLQLARTIAGELSRQVIQQRREMGEVARYAADALRVGREVGPVLEAQRAENPGVAQLLVLDTDGRVVAVSPHHPHLVGIDLSRLSFVAAARERNEDTWSSAAVALDSGERRLAMAAPRGSFTLVAYLDLTEIAAVVAASGGVHQSEVALFDRNGTFIARPGRVPARELAGLFEQPLVQGAVRGVAGTAEYEWRARRWLGSAVPVGPTGWVVVVSEPADSAFAGAHQLRWPLLFSLLLAAAMAALVGLALTRWLVRPIEALSARARAVAAGSYGPVDEVMVESGSREIVELSRSFASMSGEVQTREEARERSEGELRAAVGDLRRAAADRERLEQDLFHSQKMEAVGRLAGGVAHDFNNLLTAIIGFASLLKEVVPAEHEERASLDGILQSAQRASQLTQSLLAYSRKQVLDRRAVDLNEVIVAVEKLLGRLIGEDVDLSVSLPPEPLVVVADAGQLEQVLVNLATNARDAMPGGGSLGIAADPVELDAELASELGLRRGGPFVRITVEDTGHGMTEVVKAKVFEPFFTTKPAGKGTGLGLAIVEGIVRQHHGHVGLESAPTRGTTCTLLLERESEMPRVVPPAAAGRGPGGHESVLLVEDEPLVRRAFRRTLERAGYSVTEAGDGQEALEIFTAQPDRFDLCLVDMVMPRKNGRETAAAIAALRPAVPVLLASGYAADVLEDRGQLAEGAELITKPVAPEALLAKVRELLDRAAARGGDL